ncbi:MAG TPA: TIGR04255 family protein [Bradyrhizobium sp.]|uniref:TIGR04255 family protein n=1 Tax=Bradyrhizobium sp. TaxID=376 RepID=UPI002C48C089|nr:TIGR04255 family protein [Bradyrhizobium sp.]HLZ03425.1 TIGR04255 family protein [Bradyrhizobium sp.]
MPTPHPTYPKPTIVQVLCEIAFSSDEEINLRAAELYPTFSSEFPEIQPVQTQVQLQFMVGQPVPVPPLQPQPNLNSAFRFTTSEGKRFVQISNTSFVYQSTEPYLGWKAFKEKLLELWLASQPRTKASTITKVGLRYINRIVLTKKHPRLSDWLQPTDDLPKALISSKENFLGRVESSPMPSHLRLVTLARQPSGPDWPIGAVVLDIDRITMTQFDAVERQIAKNLEILHEDVWASFDSSSTKTLKSYLFGRLK